MANNFYIATVALLAPDPALLGQFFVLIVKAALLTLKEFFVVFLQNFGHFVTVVNF